MRTAMRSPFPRATRSCSAAAGARRPSPSATPPTRRDSTPANARSMAERDWGQGTRAVHAGLPEPRQGDPFLPGPALAGPYHLAGDPEDSPFGYNRDGNPTWSRYEAALGELEAGSAVLFASGMAAVSAV